MTKILNLNPSALSTTDITRDAVDARGELLRKRLHDITPDLVTALALLGIAILQLRTLGATDGSIRENVERWLSLSSPAASSSPTPSTKLWKPDAAGIARTVTDWIRQRKRQH